MELFDEAIKVLYNIIDLGFPKKAKYKYFRWFRIVIYVIEVLSGQ